MKIATIFLALVLGVAAGAGGVYVWMHGVSGMTGNGDDEILYYRHPHDSSITSDEPAKDSMGMDYIPVYAEDQRDDGDDRPGAVSIDPGVVQNLGVRTAAAEQGSLTPELEVLAFVDFDESGLSHSHVRTQAWVEELRVRTTGEPVSEGQILYRIDSPALINAQEELLQALRRDRGVSAARQRLRSLGMTARDIETVADQREVMPLVPVRARRAGVVRALNLTEGMYVSPGETLMEIADLSSVWVMLELFERDMDRVREGQQATVTLPFRRDASYEAELEYVYPDLETDRRSQRARLVLDNANGDLRPGMLSRVSLKGDALEDVIHVPAEAVIRTGRNNRVVVADGDGRFQVREVALGPQVGDRVEIRQGIESDETVVVSGQFLIDSESSTTFDLERLAREADADDDEVWVRGRLERMGEDGDKGMFWHEPVPEWEWPEMTMEFRLGEDLDPDAFADGDELHFRMRELDEGEYEITAWEALEDDQEEGQGDPEHDHDGHDHGLHHSNELGGGLA